MSEHTPGPWTLKVSALGAYSVVEYGDGDVLAMLNSLHEADARLIAAAPDLLAALEHLVATGPQMWTVEFEAQVRAAIAKARGEA